MVMAINTTTSQKIKDVKSAIIISSHLTSKLTSVSKTFKENCLMIFRINDYIKKISNFNSTIRGMSVIKAFHKMLIMSVKH